MSSQFTFWVWGVIVTQGLSALFHSLSFISSPRPRNDNEKQLLDLVQNYKIDMGGGIKRSYGNLFTGVSIFFTFIYILGAGLNFYFIRSVITSTVWEGVLLIQVIIYGLVFLLQVRFTFWPPIIVTGLVFIFLPGACIFR